MSGAEGRLRRADRCVIYRPGWTPSIKSSRIPSTFLAHDFMWCDQQTEGVQFESLNNARPPSKVSAGACRAQSPLEGEPLPRRMKPDASPSIHDDIHLQLCARRREEEIFLRISCIHTSREPHRHSQATWTPTATPSPRMSRAI